MTKGLKIIAHVAYTGNIHSAMSGLTAEQQRRMEENRRKAMQKLAAKKRPAPPSTAASLSGAVMPPQPKRPAPSMSRDLMATPQCTINHSSRDQPFAQPPPKQFQSKFYTRGQSSQRQSIMTSTSSSSSSSSTSTFWRGSRGGGRGRGGSNYVPLKAKITATVTLASRRRFKVLVPYDSDLIQVFKEIPSRTYGK